MTISSKPECLERRDVVCFHCLFDTCNPSYFWSPSRFEVYHPGVAGHACQMSKPLDSLLLYVVVGWCCSDHFPDVLVS